jgi:hypothetical protein
MFVKPSLYPIFLSFFVFLASFAMEHPIPKTNFAQEEAFHEKLIAHNLIQHGAQAYYKKIDPITSNPTDLRADRWLITTVSIEGQRIRPTADGVYTHGDISFTINSETFDPTQPSNILVTHRNVPYNISFNVFSEKKVPVLPNLDGYDAILNAMLSNKLSLRRYVTVEEIIEIPGKNPCVISVECKKQRTQPIKLRGMEIVCSKDKNTTTKIFFDFTDQNNESIELCNPIECIHSEMIVDKTVICIKDHQAYECTGKKICGFFDSPETRKKWVPNESNFYDQNRKIVTFLPSCYSNDHQETPKDCVVWVFEEGHNSFYQLAGVEEIKNANEYIYSNGNLFFTTLPYKATYKECFSNNKTIELDYLVKVSQPHILINTHTDIDGGKRSKWSTGVYEKIPEGDSSSWQRIGTAEKDSIDFNNEPQFDIVFPAQPLTIQQNKNWCDAAQRFFIDFPANIHTCNQEISDNLSSWNKLTKLNLSDLKLENGLTWNNLFTALGAMTQLTSLDFKNNHPVADLMANKWYSEMADQASDYYCTFANCLSRLINLEELHIQGLWLKPHRYLGRFASDVFYRNNPESMSCITEVAIITGIINHRKQIGIKNIIQHICALKFLKNISIDGIPHYGTLPVCRKTLGQRFLFLLPPFCIIVAPFDEYDKYCQDIALKQLVIDSSNQLAQIATLQTISVYSPGGNCVDYFSKDFRDKLDQIRKSNKNLPDLNIISKDLQ